MTTAEPPTPAGRVPAGQASSASITDRITELHDAAVEAGRDSYVDPATRYAVFTAAFLAERGTCCSSDCRHCPYR